MGTANVCTSRHAIRSPETDIKVIRISSLDLFVKSNIQDFQPMSQAELAIAGDAEATLPSLIEEVKRQITADRKRVFDERGKKIAEAHAKQREQAIEEARWAWDQSPISLSRLAAELWPLIKNEDWSLVGWQGFIGGWPGRVWNMDKHYRYIGGQGGGGNRHKAPAAAGAAPGHQKNGPLASHNSKGGGFSI